MEFGFGEAFPLARWLQRRGTGRRPGDSEPGRRRVGRREPHALDCATTTAPASTRCASPASASPRPAGRYGLPWNRWRSTTTAGRTALGPSHFVARTWSDWHHHVALVSAAHAFGTLHCLARTQEKRRGLTLLHQVVREMQWLLAVWTGGLRATCSPRPAHGDINLAGPALGTLTGVCRHVAMRRCSADLRRVACRSGTGSTAT